MVQNQSSIKDELIDPFDTSMAVIERSVSIGVPPEAVPPLISDPVHYPIIFPHVDHVKACTRFPELGGKLNLVYKVGGITFEIEYTVIEDRPGLRVLRSQATATSFGTKRPFEGINMWQWDAEGSGTRLTGTYQYEIPQTRFGKELERWVLRRYNAENLERSLKNIKRVLEVVPTLGTTPATEK